MLCNDLSFFWKKGNDVEMGKLSRKALKEEMQNFLHCIYAKDQEEF